MLMWAADGCNFEVAEELIKKGQDVNKIGEWGQTPFIKACYKKDFKLARLMAINGGDISIRDTHYNKTALEYLEEKQREEILRILGKWEEKKEVKIKEEEVKKRKNDKEIKKGIWGRLKGIMGR